MSFRSEDIIFNVENHVVLISEQQVKIFKHLSQKERVHSMEKSGCPLGRSVKQILLCLWTLPIIVELNSISIPSTWKKPCLEGNISACSVHNSIIEKTKQNKTNKPHYKLLDLKYILFASNSSIALGQMERY